MRTPFDREITPDWPEFVETILRKRTPRRVHFIELFLDAEVQQAIAKRYDLMQDWVPNDPVRGFELQVRIQRFLGYDYVRAGLDGLNVPLKRVSIEDTAALKREGGRSFQDEHVGPITNWEEFEKYPWPDPAKAGTTTLEWYEKNLPDDMCIIASGGFAHFAEYLCWLMGYETLCYALYEQRDLVEAISRRLEAMFRSSLKIMLQFDRVKVVWGSDDMGFKTGPLFSPADMRRFVLPGHKLMAQMSHDAGRPYLLHACGDLSSIIGDLVNDVKIDGKHSFEDTIERVIEAKDTYGKRIALLGGVDVDFLCRADEKQIRARTRETLRKCMPGGGYCLGTGNSVANYIPLGSYLAMMDEGRKFAVQAGD
jgi:uroporphyrinogen decarboxylase